MGKIGVFFMYLIGAWACATFVLMLLYGIIYWVFVPGV